MLNCPLFPGEKTRFGHMDTSTKSAPSTNTLILCEEGHCKQENKQFWLHNIGAHFASECKNTACAQRVATACELLFGRTDGSGEEVKEDVDKILCEPVFSHFEGTKKLLMRINSERQQVIEATLDQAKKQKSKKEKGKEEIDKKKKRDSFRHKGFKWSGATTKQ